MGVDIFGRAPTSQVGKLFNYNYDWWRPLADYCCSVAPDITNKCKYWQSNDDGLDRKDALALAKRLEAEIMSGRTAMFAKRYGSVQETMPNVPCGYCAATGTREPAAVLGAGNPVRGSVKCTVCDGTGYVRPDCADYSFFVERVKEFVAFLKACGGFNIC
jgi:hypothetical protein